MKKYIIIPLFCLFAAPIAHGQGGIIDNSFGNGGKIVHNIAGMDIVYDIKVLPDDKFLATGIAGNRMVVAKFLKDGALDKDFAGSGFKFIDFPAPSGYPDGKGYTVTTQKDGKILVGGEAVTHLNQWGSNDRDFAVARLNTDGSYDMSFNNSGMVSVDFYSSDKCVSIIEQPDGKILLAGRANQFNICLARLNDNGSLDSTFNGNGKIIVELEGYGGAASAMLQQSNGKIIIISDVDPGTNTGYDVRMIRYNIDGTPDSSFGDNGVVTTNISYREVPKAATLLGDGSILVCGLVRVSDGDDDILLKYKPDGTLDSTFGMNGYVTLGMLPGSDDMANDLVVQPDGKIVIAGRTRFNNGTGATCFSLARFSANGVLGVSFGDQGKILQPAITPPYAHDWCNALALQSDGRIIAGGYSDIDAQNTKAFAFTRYHSDVTASITEQQANTIGLHPNPVSKTLTVITGIAYAMEYNIVNTLGQTIQTGTLQPNSNTIGVSDLTPGSYYIRLSNEQQGVAVTKQFVKE